MANVTRNDFAICLFYDQFHKTNITWLLKIDDMASEKI